MEFKKKYGLDLFFCDNLKPENVSIYVYQFKRMLILMRNAVQRCDIFRNLRTILEIPQFEFLTNLLSRFKLCKYKVEQLNMKRVVKDSKVFDACIELLKSDFTNAVVKYKHILNEIHKTKSMKQVYVHFLKIYSLDVNNIDLVKYKNKICIQVQSYMRNITNKEDVTCISIDSIMNEMYNLETILFHNSNGYTTTFQLQKKIEESKCMQGHAFDTLMSEIRIGLLSKLLYGKIKSFNIHIAQETNTVYDEGIDTNKIINIDLETIHKSMYQFFFDRLTIQERDIRLLYDLAATKKELESRLSDLKKVNLELGMYKYVDVTNTDIDVTNTDVYVTNTAVSVEISNEIQIGATNGILKTSCQEMLIANKTVDSTRREKIKNLMRIVRKLNVQIERIDIQNDELEFNKKQSKRMKIVL